jgi:hypothetical protein
VEGSCEHGNEPSESIKVGKFLSSYTTGGFSRRAQLHEVSLFHSKGLSAPRQISMLENTLSAVVNCLINTPAAPPYEEGPKSFTAAVAMFAAVSFRPHSIHSVFV